MASQKKIKTKPQDPNNYWEQLERLEKLIRASEFKAGIIFSFHSLVIGLLIDRLDYFQEAIMQNVALIVLGSLWLICVLISIVYCFKCFTPHIESKQDKNVFFFKDAAHAFGSIDDYTKELMDTCSDDTKIYEMLSQQIYVESKIIEKKFDSVQKSIWLFGVSIIFIIIMLIIWVIIS